jgi:mono/diheme cytochrome c family protein
LSFAKNASAGIVLRRNAFIASAGPEGLAPGRRANPKYAAPNGLLKQILTQETSRVKLRWMSEHQFSSCFTALMDPIRRPRKRDLIILAAIAALLAFGPIPELAQETLQPPATPDAIERGHLFFSDNCGICHGPDAHNGDRGPDLNTGRFKHGGSDADLFRTITHGIPGTIMPANNLPADQVREIIRFLRSTVVAARTPITGNRENGEKFFWNAGKCADCHMVHGKGRVFGPDLSQIGGTRTVEYLIGKLRDPSRDITTGLREPTPTITCRFPTPA